MTISIIRWQPEFLDSLSCLIVPDFVNLVDSKRLLKVSQAELVFRDCAKIIRGEGAKNESRKEKYQTIHPLSTKAH